jgi:hypothetical protein
MFYQEWPSGLKICFSEGSTQLGKHLHYNDPDRIYEILKAAHEFVRSFLHKYAPLGLAPRQLELFLSA